MSLLGGHYCRLLMREFAWMKMPKFVTKSCFTCSLAFSGGFRQGAQSRRIKRSSEAKKFSNS